MIMNEEGPLTMDDRISRLDHLDPRFSSEYGQVLSWIHQTVDQAQLKNELVEYARSLGKASAVESMQASLIGVEGKIAYCINRGAKLSLSSIAKANDAINRVTSKQEDTSPDWEYIPETARSRAIRAYVNCYSRIDNAKTMVLRGKLDRRDLAPEVRKIVQTYGQTKTAIVKQLVDHYNDAYLEARQDDATKDWIKPLATIAETLSLMLNNRASIRAGAKGAKARKMRSTVETMDRKGEKAASKVSYKDEDDKLGIRSVDPTNLVGAEAAVVFNTKNRHCEVYLAKQGSSLSVQGARIVNFDESTSLGKTLRKPESDLPHWVRATTLKRLEVLLNGIKGKTWEVTGKLNKNCIIVKVL
jgi:hypothetical protein